MKKGTIEYTVRTERKKSKSSDSFESELTSESAEKIESEFCYRVRGHDMSDTFDPETINQNLVEKIRQEHSRFLLSNPNILRYESRLVERLPYRESEDDKEKE